MHSGQNDRVEGVIPTHITQEIFISQHAQEKEEYSVITAFIHFIHQQHDLPVQL